MTQKEFECKMTKTSATNISSSQSDIFVGHYGFENTTPEKEYVHSSSSTAFRLYFITKGKGILNVINKQYVLNKNSVFVLIPGVDMGYHTNTLKPMSYYWVSFQGFLAKDFFLRLGLTPDTPIIQDLTISKKITESFYQNLVIEPHDHLITDIIFSRNFYNIILLILSDKPKEQEKEETPRDYIYQAITYINNNYTNSALTIKKVASSIGIHENYLSLLFKKSTNITFTQYVTQKRIQLAVSMMDEGKTSIKEIAYDVGFEDPFYFSKVFKQFNTISPSEHLRKIQAFKDKKD